MDSPPSEPWTYAARAAYYGDRVCRLCDHHNPAAAKFCNDCGSPLHLRRCNQCDAVNDQAATNCHKCGAECPALPGATSASPAADPTPTSGARTDTDIAATVTQPLFTASALRAGWRLLKPAQFGLAVIATILIVGAYGAYRISAVKPDAIEVASQPIGASEHNAPRAASAVPITMESKPVEPETTTALQAPIPTTNPEAPKHASARQRPVPVPTTKRVSARQRPVPELHGRVGATPPLAQSRPGARGDAPVAQA